MCKEQSGDECFASLLFRALNIRFFVFTIRILQLSTKTESHTRKRVTECQVAPVENPPFFSSSLRFVMLAPIGFPTYGKVRKNQPRRRERKSEKAKKLYIYIYMVATLSYSLSYGF